MDVTKRICEVAGQAPLVGICFQALRIILETAQAHTKIDEKAKEIIAYASFLQKSMETIENAGGGDQYLKENCLALLCAEAFEFQKKEPRKQSWGKCMCSLVCAKCEAKTLDGLAIRLKDMTLKLSLHCQTLLLEKQSVIVEQQSVIVEQQSVIVEQQSVIVEKQSVIEEQQSVIVEKQSIIVEKQSVIVEQQSILSNLTPKPCEASLGNSSLKLNNKEELLKFVTEPGIRVLALCGMGGLGKTTLLIALHQDFQKSGKQAKVFIEVGKDPANLMEIQTQILQGLESKNETFTTTQQGRIRLEDCLKGLKKKGLTLCLSIDNVWEVRHLKELLPQHLHDHLPESSCLMISTRSQKVAKEFGDICCQKDANAFQVFHPKLMGTQEAEELFMKCAKIKNKKEEWNLINEIVPLCGGLPLAIKTYGTYFRRLERRKETEWRKVKQRILTFTESPSTADDDDEVPQSLELSIDAQNQKVQDAFIDAALFWRGKPLEMARCALYVRHEDILEVLLEESFFYCKKKWGRLYLECHDIFLAIAEKRATNKSWKYLNTSKMEISKDRMEGVRGIEIHQNLEFETLQKNLLYIRCKGALISSAWNTLQAEKHDLKVLQLSQSVNPGLLQCFPNLQLLSIGGFEYGAESTQVHHQLLSSSFKNFSNLRFMEIDGKNEQLLMLPNSFGDLVHLQELRLRNFSCLQLLPDFSNPLTWLKELNLSQCTQLTRLPDTLGPLSSLQRLALSGCTQLARLPDTLGPLPALLQLALSKCTQLACLPDTLGPLPALQRLALSGCTKLACLPHTLGPLPALQWLTLSWCAKLAHLPDSLGPLPTLQWLTLSECTQLARLPDSLGPLTALQRLALSECTQLDRLPDTLGPLPALEELDLSGCAQLKCLPDTLGPLSALEELDLSGCAQLACLPDTLGPLPILQRLHLSGCAQLTRLPDTLGPLLALKALDLSRCTQLICLPDTLGPLPALQRLHLFGCAQLTHLPDTLGPLPDLTWLHLSQCNQLVCLPDTFGPLLALTRLHLSGCAQLTCLPDTFGPLPVLELLDLSGCVQLASLPDTLGPLPALTQLDLSGCAHLVSLPDTLGPLPALTELVYTSSAQHSSFLDALSARLHKTPKIKPS